MGGIKRSNIANKVFRDDQETLSFIGQTIPLNEDHRGWAAHLADYQIFKREAKERFEVETDRDIERDKASGLIEMGEAFKTLAIIAKEKRDLSIIALAKQHAQERFEEHVDWLKRKFGDKYDLSEAYEQRRKYMEQFRELEMEVIRGTFK